MGRLHITMKRSVSAIKFSLLPILVMIYPLFFHYGNNANIVSLSSLSKLFAPMIGIAILVYSVLCVVYKGRMDKAAIAAFVFLVFFSIYGVVFDWLRNLDVVQVEHYTFLPLFILLAIYSSWFITRLSAKHSLDLWKVLTIILSGLMFFNLAKIIPIEVQKARIADATTVIQTPNFYSAANNNDPDIYYIILDEAAGFEAMRQYWHYEGVDQFVDFLKSKGFFVAEESHVSHADTLYALAMRLNYQDYPYPSDKLNYFEAITHNRVMLDLKNIGYTTVVFDEAGRDLAYSTRGPIEADYSFYPTSNVIETGSVLSDEFVLLVASQTMIRPFINRYDLQHPVYGMHKAMIFYTMEKVAKLYDIPSPKFVYVHLLLPHVPFMFDAQGRGVFPKYYENWNYYLGNYIFATHVAQTMITNILASADPKRPPVIILQSDHGARNSRSPNPDYVRLENYPEEYKSFIINALYLPGCDPSVLTQDMNPINTFPIVFNCYFKADIPLIK